MSAYTAEKKLAAFSNLRAGWHYGSGIPVLQVSLERACRALDLYARFGVTETDAFCGSEGEVMVTAYLGGHYIECDFVSETEVNFRHEDDQSQIVHEVVLKATQDLSAVISKAVREARGERWLLSDLSTQQISIGAKTGFRTMYSRIPAKTVALQYLTSNVREQLRGKFARTSGSFTEMSAVSHRRFGSLNSLPSSLSTENPRLLLADKKTQSLATNAITMSKMPPTVIYEESQKTGKSMT